jgi:thymidylate synthase (FAD)
MLMSIEGEEMWASQAIDEYCHRPVKLVSYTKMDTDYAFDKGFGNEAVSVEHLIAWCARVSNPTNQNNTKTMTKLIEYLSKNKHWSPFEMVSVCLEINTTRDIARQILRHRSFAFQEFSQRYADPTKHLEFVYREARLQDEKNRQNSIETDDEELKTNWMNWQEEILDITKKAYEWAIENGLAKEVARSILPEGLTPSRMYMNGSIRSWIHFVEVRTHESTQKEHRIIAEACAKELANIIPIIKTYVYNPKMNEKGYLGL